MSNCKEDFYINSPKAQRTLKENEQKKYKNKRIGNDALNSDLWLWHGYCTHELKATMVAYIKSSYSISIMEDGLKKPIYNWGAIGF